MINQNNSRHNQKNFKSLIKKDTRAILTTTSLKAQYTE